MVDLGKAKEAKAKEIEDHKGNKAEAKDEEEKKHWEETKKKLDGELKKIEDDTDTAKKAVTPVKEKEGELSKDLTA